jgi:glycine/D-amino acid oxidase-like deaminating enzyme
MKIRSRSPFWPLKDGFPTAFPALEDDRECEVAVIGGGFCGASVAHSLAEAGVRTVLLDQRDIGHGSTSASTALVMYELDTPLSELIQLRGERPAVRSYRVCREAVDRVRRLSLRAGVAQAFEAKRSLYCASRSTDCSDLQQEFRLRRRHGFRVEWLDRDRIRENFSFERSGALLTADAGQVDPYLLTHALLKRRNGRSLEVYDRTQVVRLQHLRSGVRLVTDRGHRVTARKVVFASGFETNRFLRRRVVRLKSTYAIATEPITDFDGWGFDRCLIWETGRPYLYFRTTREGRIIVGGGDEDFVNPHRRDALIPAKANSLLRKAQKMFPRMNLEIFTAWAGTFGETEDSLPYIGPVKGYPNAYFALCFGANGTTFAILAGEIIRDLYLRNPNPDARLFRFDR